MKSLNLLNKQDVLTFWGNIYMKIRLWKCIFTDNWVKVYNKEKKDIISLVSIRINFMSLRCKIKPTGYSKRCPPKVNNLVHFANMLVKLSKIIQSSIFIWEKPRPRIKKERSRLRWITSTAASPASDLQNS